MQACAPALNVSKWPYTLGSACTASGTFSHRSGLSIDRVLRVRLKCHRLELDAPELISILAPYLRRAVQQANRDGNGVPLGHATKSSFR